MKNGILQFIGQGYMNANQASVNNFIFVLCFWLGWVLNYIALTSYWATGSISLLFSAVGSVAYTIICYEALRNSSEWIGTWEGVEAIKYEKV